MKVFFVTTPLFQTLPILCNQRIHKDVFVNKPMRMEKDGIQCPK